MLKRYLLFSAPHYEGCGWDDFAGSYATIEEAERGAYEESGWAHIVDLEADKGPHFVAPAIVRHRHGWEKEPRWKDGSGMSWRPDDVCEHDFYTRSRRCRRCGKDEEECQ